MARATPSAALVLEMIGDLLAAMQPHGLLAVRAEGSALVSNCGFVRAHFFLVSSPQQCGFHARHPCEMLFKATGFVKSAAVIK